MLKNVMVYLVGFSGTGKLTVGRELALLLKARVVDNHSINNPILGLIENDRVTPFPEGVWDQIAKVRQAVLDAIATLSAPESNFDMTTIPKIGKSTMLLRERPSVEVLCLFQSDCCARRRSY
jgi:hypothetical protein